MSNNTRPEEFSVTEAYRTDNRGVDSPTVIIIVNQGIKGGIQISLDQYTSDLEEIEGYTVIVVEVSGGSPVDLKTYIAGQYNRLLNSFHPLAGCVFVGDLPVPWGGPVGNIYPLDLFYMDLLNVWEDINGDGLFVAVPDHPEPVIWVGRLTAGPLDGNEIDLLNDYFAKIHKYRIGHLMVLDRAMAYVDDEWIPKGDYGLRSVYNNVTVVNDKMTTNADDYKSRLTENYEFVQLVVHSAVPTEHNFKDNFSWDGSVTSMDIRDIGPQSAFYTVDSCNAARYTENNYIGGWYIFSKGNGLVAIGETHTGNSMDGPGEFYKLFRDGLSLGETFLTWLKVGGRANYHKDRTILGDPTLKRRAVYPNH